MSEIDKQIKTLEDQIQKLKDEKEQLAKDEFNKIFGPELQKLADEFHNCICHWNHTDGCSYYYEKWEAGKLGYAKQREFDRINQFISSGYSIEQIKQIIKIIKTTK